MLDDIDIDNLSTEEEITICCPKCDFEIPVTNETLNQKFFSLKCPKCNHRLDIAHDD